MKELLAHVIVETLPHFVVVSSSGHKSISITSFFSVQNSDFSFDASKVLTRLKSESELKKKGSD
jgi:hypothetical protein